jgi:hypothetical protein
MVVRSAGGWDVDTMLGAVLLSDTCNLELTTTQSTRFCFNTPVSRRAAEIGI